MAIIQRIKNLLSDPALTYRIELTPEAYPYVDGMTPKELYASQANLHAVVSFLADSVAQLPIKVYRREDETKRERDRDSIAAKLLWLPNSDQTAYELINALMIEFYLYGTAILWHLPDPQSESGHQLRLLPRDWITNSEAESAYALESVTVMARGGAPAVKVPKTDFVQFRMYSPGEPGSYQSPVSALKNTLREQMQADKFRTQIWRSSGRFNAYITRPKDVAPWDDETKKRWVEAFRQGWGAEGGSAGKMPLLEDGMEIKPYQFNAEQAQYAETKQLSREDVAAAYHVNPSLIWHTSTQTYASAKDNARALYADCLGPTLQMLQQRMQSMNQ
jgi:HK97 family phage portal protein